MSSTTLVVVVSGSVYESFAEDLFSSAAEFFRPTKKVDFLLLPGRSGWPDATMYRHHVLNRHLPNSSYVFLSDADMRFEGRVGKEILPVSGISATLHPGYVNTWPAHLPYEKNPNSACFVPEGKGRNYYCGGFWGGTRQAVQNMTRVTSYAIDLDKTHGHTPLWHDESALNWALAYGPPEVVLSPSYCYPDNDSFYKTIWPNQYERKLIALDKTSDQREGR